MGLFDFVKDVVSTTVKVATTPIAVAKDVIAATKGEEMDNTKKHVKSIKEGLEEIVDDLMD